jgi:hypothetical protein
MKNMTGQKLPRPFRDYYRNLGDAKRISGLPIPFANRVAPVEGDSKGHRLATGARQIFSLTGDWVVIDESDAGYPVGIVDTDRQSGVACTLETISDSPFQNAILGYDHDFGTFVVAKSDFNRGISSDWEVFNRDSDPDELRRRFTKDERGIPFVYADGRSRYLMCRYPSHQPWAALETAGLTGFKSLRKRYEKVADEIGKTYNPNPPGQRDREKPSGVNPERVKNDLLDIGRKLCPSENDRGDSMNRISELSPGDVIVFPIDGQAQGRKLIVDDRSPVREGTVPLLGEKGAKYHIEQNDEQAFLNFYSPTRTDWVGQSACLISEIRVNPEPL